MPKELTRCQLAERSIIKKYRKELWAPFVAAVKRYELVKEDDRIAVCISGGKDSFLLAKLMQELHRHSDIPFEPVFLGMDPGYNPDNRRKIIENSALLEIPIRIFESDIFDAAHSADRSPCYLCARMRRGALYSRAKDLGCNKIALGHHLNDVIETTIMGMFYSSQLQGMLPMLHSTNFEGMSLIRPMYCIREEDIIAWKNYNNLDFLQCACRFTEQNADGDGEDDSKRREIKQLIAELKKTNPDIESSIFNSIHAVNLETFPGYKVGKKNYSFLEKYNKK
ncbi:MAG: tRNA lysidine(34) synthetase [Lachnospiraceae bacterium]|jgi:tRNA 2-thiocytidine biosynthesis protein TtcA